MKKYTPKEIELKWQSKWEDWQLAKARNESSKPKKYILDMFPYPSGAGLHVGHVESYTATDIYSRYSRMKGFEVLHPQGWDAFGLPAENYAIKTGIHPTETTKKAIETFTRQIKGMGFLYDWDREVNSSDPEYYKWTQWIFLQFYKNGLAYQKLAKVNWCPSCETVLANEQANGGVCDRCGTVVIQKDLKQWFFKITDFIEDTEVNGKKISGLLSGLDQVDWPESTKAAQRNWINRSEGATVKFKVKSLKLKVEDEQQLEVFTTRPDTLFGCTYMVVCPEHPIINEQRAIISNYDEVVKYIEASKKKTDLERTDLNKDKSGVEIKGIHAVNPVNGKEIPIFVADYVLSGYGTGAIMAVPAHDERDHEFAKKYKLPIIEVVAPMFIVDGGKDKPREDKKTERRKNIVAIVKDPRADEYICLDWEKFGWTSFIIGGIEEGESAEQAALREAKEETGYQNLKIVKKVSGTTHSYYFAEHKNINRYAEIECFLLELVNDEKLEVEAEHTKNHRAIRVKASEVRNFVSINAHKYYISQLLDGEKPFTDHGVNINSGFLDDLKTVEAKEKVIRWLEEKELGRLAVNYRLRDWLVSRQRYWGAPIPIIHCLKCGAVPVPESELPVMLPDDVDFRAHGESPLVHSVKFQDVKCPICGDPARREPDTMDTFVCSSWYYLRYADPKNTEEFASKANIKKWLPVDLYVGGAEHSVLHLLYARFFTKALKSFGYLDFDEPFLKLRHQGTILAADGSKMSKSKGNVVNPDEIVEQYGADALRLYEMFMGPLEDSKPWNTSSISGIVRFLERVWKNLLEDNFGCNNLALKNNDEAARRLLNKTIKKVTQDIEAMKYNTAISELMKALNDLREILMKCSVTPDTEFMFKKNFLLLLAPMAPHIAEEIWQNLKGSQSIFLEPWPIYDENLIKDGLVNMVVQVNGKVRDTLDVSAEITEAEVKKMALANEKISKWLEGTEVIKVIFVRGKLINIVTKQ